MLHYYFLKYWSRGLVGLMVSIVVGYFGIFSYSLFAAQKAQDQVASETVELSAIPQQETYAKSLKVFEGIQELKVKNQDTTKLETMYADSVKNLSNNNQKEAEAQLQELQSQIAKLNSAITPTPSDAIASASAAPSIDTLTPEDPTGTGSAEATEDR